MPPDMDKDIKIEPKGEDLDVKPKREDLDSKIRREERDAKTRREDRSNVKEENRGRESRSESSRHKDRRDERDRERRRSRDRHERRRSRTPESSSRRPRSRERRRDRSRDRARDRERDRGHTRRRSREDRKRRGGSGGDVSMDDADKHERNRKAVVRHKGPLPSQADSWAITQGEEPEKPKEQRNFGNSGLLAAASNSVQQSDGTSITLKYHEPPEARKPSPRDLWKLFVFKGEDLIDTIDLSLRSCWLIGKDMAVVDLPAEHPSISKQHAVIQFRYVEKRNEFGDKIGKVKPYVIDLETANGTVLNDERIPDSRYLELRHKDMLQFGKSTREYVVMLAPRE